jgi:hypothetical protein
MIEPWHFGREVSIGDRVMAATCDLGKVVWGSVPQ